MKISYDLIFLPEQSKQKCVVIKRGQYSDWFLWTTEFVKGSIHVYILYKNIIATHTVSICERLIHCLLSLNSKLRCIILAA